MISVATKGANTGARGAAVSGTGASVHGDRGKVSRGPYPEDGSGQGAQLTEAESKAARRQARRIRANERRREKRLAARLRVQERAAKAREEERLSLESGGGPAAQGATQASTAGDGNSTRNPQGGSQVSYYRVPIVMPGMGTSQGQQHHRSCPISGGGSVSSQQSSGGSTGGKHGGGWEGSRVGAPSIGGPWGASDVRGGSSGGGGSGFSAGGSGLGRNSGPMDSAAIHALLSDPTKSKILMGNLLSERIKEVEFARRKRDSLMEQKRRLEGERFKAQQRQRSNMDRRRQPTLPIDDALLHSLPPMDSLRVGSGDEEERPRVVPKKLTIASAMAGPILRVWDFLHTTSQVITLSAFGLDDFADSLHYSGEPSVMVVEVHTRLLSVILRDGKFPKSLKEAMEAGTVVQDPSANGDGLAGTGSKQISKYPLGVDSPGVGVGGLSKKGKGSASRTHSRRRSINSIGPDGAGEGLEGEGDDEWEDLLACLLPPRSERNEHHDNANNLVTPLTWQTVLAMALPCMGPYARAVASPSNPKDAPSAAAAPAGTPMSGRGSGSAVMAAEMVEAERTARGRAVMRARRNLIEKEYPSLTLEEKVLLLEVLVDTAYETKRIRTVLEENMRDRMALESQRREEIIAYNRELREKVNAQKSKVQAKLRKLNEAQYRRRMIESEKAAKERAKADNQVVVQNGAASRAVTTSDGGSSSGDRNGDANGAGEGGDGSPSGGGGSSKGKGKAKKGKGKAASPEGGSGNGGGSSGGGSPKINPKVYEPDRSQLQAGIAEDTVKEACGGEFRVKSIDVPEDDVDPTEQEEEEDKAAEVMLENMSRQELIRRRREMDAKEKDRARRRQDWKDSRQHRLQQGRALNSLKAALEKGEVHMLQEALKEGRKASMEGEDEDGVRFLCPEMRDAYLALAAAKERMGRVEILEKYRKLMEDKFVRTEPLGTDRNGNRYWMFNGDSRIHVEMVTRKLDAPSPPVTGNGNASKNSSNSAIEAEPMIIVDDDHDLKCSAVGNGNISEFPANGIGSTGKRKVEEGEDSMEPVKRPRHDPPDYYHPVWFESTWTYYDNEEEFHSLIMRLDPRGKREGELRQVLQERFDVSELERRSKETSNRGSVGKRRLAWRKEGSALLGKRVRRVFGRRVTGAEVLKWVSAESNGGMALWHVQHDDGDEEDLEEHEVKEGLALAKAEEQQGADSGSAMSELMRVAVDDSLAKSFSDYVNRLNKMQAIKPRDLGLCALRDNLLHREAGMLDDIKERSSGYSKGTNSATPRGTWLRLVRDATEISHLREAILTLEETLRGLQAGEDKIEGGRMEMEAKGWNFDPDSHIFIGRRCRRFFKEYGQSNCTVVAYLPAKNNDPELWHVLHDDGDAEDLEAHELEKAAKHYEDGVQELPISDEDEYGEDDGSREGRESSGPGDDVNDDEDQHDDHDEDVEDQTAFSPSPTKHRATLWETWGARQGWIKGIKAAATVATLSLGFLTLVETAYLFGIGKESMLEANRSRARMAKAWETPGGSSKSGKRAAAVAASVAISNFAEMDVDVSEASVSAAASTASGASSTGGGNASSAGGGKRRSSRETTGGSGSCTSFGGEGTSTRASGKRQRR